MFRILRSNYRHNIKQFNIVLKTCAALYNIHLRNVDKAFNGQGHPLFAHDGYRHVQPAEQQEAVHHSTFGGFLAACGVIQQAEQPQVQLPDIEEEVVLDNEVSEPDYSSDEDEEIDAWEAEADGLSEEEEASYEEEDYLMSEEEKSRSENLRKRTTALIERDAAVKEKFKEYFELYNQLFKTSKAHDSYVAQKRRNVNFVVGKIDATERSLMKKIMALNEEIQKLDTGYYFGCLEEGDLESIKRNLDRMQEQIQNNNNTPINSEEAPASQNSEESGPTSQPTSKKQKRATPEEETPTKRH